MARVLLGRLFERPYDTQSKARKRARRQSIRRQLSTLSLLLLVSVPCPAWQNGSATLERANAAYRAGNPVEAEQILKVILKSEPRELGALLLMGVVLDTQQLYGQAEPYYEQALGLAPRSAQVLNNVANHYFASGNVTKARQYYERAVAIDAHHTNANLQLARMNVDDKHGQLALSYLRQLNSSAASEPGAVVLRARAMALCRRCTEVRETAKAVENRSSDVGPLFSFGIALAECKFYSEAERYFSRALDLDPANFEILYNLGLASLRSGDLDRAQAAFERALTLRPRDPDVLRNLTQTRVQLAFLTFHRQGPDAALRELDKTAAADRTSDDYLLRAQILDEQGKVAEAAAALNQALRTSPANISLYHEAIDFLLKHKLYHEAEAFLEESLRIRPNDRDLLLAQALTLNLLRRNTDSEALLEKIQASWPTWDRVYLLKGMLLEIGLKSEEARRTLAKAIALGANTPEAYYYEALAITHAAPQDLDAAQNAIGRAMALSSDDPYIYLLAGNIALSRKDYSTAVKQLLLATRLEPSLVPAHYALRHAYSALGEDQKAELEMESLKRIAKETNGTNEGRFAVEDFLFAVRPPG